MDGLGLITCMERNEVDAGMYVSEIPFVITRNTT